MASSKWSKMAREAALEAGIDPDIFDAQMRHESVNYNEDVIAGRRSSPAGAQGIAQIMPDTAKGWGVNPLNPREALRAAATNMAKYIKTYGGWEPALRAYNAGPGAIEKSKGYRETNNYVKVILGGRTPNDPGRSSDAGDTSRTSRRASTSVVPGSTMDAPEERPVFDVLRRLQGRNEDEGEKSSLARTVETLQRITAPPPQTATAPTRSASGSGRPAPTARKSNVAPGSIYELFYDPMGGWDKGKDIGPIGGHQHVHVAAEPKRIKWILDQAKKRFNLHVGEHPDFDKVDPVHTQGSHHYKREAGDVSGSDSDERAFVNWIRKKYGF